jgi:hypothetical protein
MQDRLVALVKWLAVFPFDPGQKRQKTFQFVRRQGSQNFIAVWRIHPSNGHLFLLGGKGTD